MRRSIFVVLGCMPFASPAPAAASSPDQGPPAATNMAAIYQRLCLDAFPDPRAVGLALEASHATRMNPNETGGLLQDGPGSGWRVSTATADYTLTIEAPPYNTCALARMTRDGLPTALPYVAAVQAYARRHGLLMGKVETLDQKTANEADERVLATALTKRSAKDPGEFSMYVTTDYHGRYAGWAADDTTGGTGIEVRMEHHIAVGD